MELHIRRIQQSKKVDQLIVATTIAPEDEAVVQIAERLAVPSSRGSVNDVLDRFYQALKSVKADYVVRLTSDCPLIDPALIDRVIDFAISNNLDYASNVLEPSYPDGQDVEVFRYSALERAWKEAQVGSEREHVTPYIWKNSTFNGGTLFKSANYSEGHNFAHLRMTVDEPRDLEVVRILVKNLGVRQDWKTYADYLEQHQEVRRVNDGIQRNEGYDKSIKTDQK